MPGLPIVNQPLSKLPIELQLEIISYLDPQNDGTFMWRYSPRRDCELRQLNFEMAFDDLSRVILPFGLPKVLNEAQRPWHNCYDDRQRDRSIAQLRMYTQEMARMGKDNGVSFFPPHAKILLFQLMQLVKGLLYPPVGYL